MSYILIHSNNSCLVGSKNFGLDKCLPFIQDPNKDVDLSMSEFVVEQIAVKSPSAVFIKYALTDNYISFLGLRLAMHIRLTRSNNSISTVPIIMIGEETVLEISKLSDIFSIIGTSGVYHSNELDKNVQVFIDEIYEGKLIGLKDERAFINKIEIPPPSNYSSHHSVTNDWSLLRWAKYLGCIDQIKIQSDIVSSLYYKYLIVKYPVAEAQAGSNVLIPGKGNVLIIDDELDKGWNHLYKKIITVNPDIKIVPFDYDFMGKNKKQIVSDFVQKIRAVEIDLIILDLRLCDEDFYENSHFRDLTGFILLEEIKAYNKGLQTIIVSASNKIWNYTYAMDSYADGYLLKESPENSQDPYHTATTLKKIRSTIEISLERKYLKIVWGQLLEIRTCFEELIIAESIVEIKKQKLKIFGAINQFLEMFFNNISQRTVFHGNAYQLLFVVIEILNNDIIDSQNPLPNSSGKYNWQIRRASKNLLKFSKNGNAICKGSDLETDKRAVPWDQKTFNTAHSLGVDLNLLSNLSKLMDIRHEYIHQDITTGRKVEPNLDNSKELFKIVHLMCMNYK